MMTEDEMVRLNELLVDSIQIVGKPFVSNHPEDLKEFDTPEFQNKMLDRCFTTYDALPESDRRDLFAWLLSRTAWECVVRFIRQMDVEKELQKLLSSLKDQPGVTADMLAAEPKNEEPRQNTLPSPPAPPRETPF